MTAETLPTHDKKALRSALGRFATGVCIVTTRDADGRDVGLTINSFSSVSLDPPMVSWCLARSSPSLQAFLHAEHFAVHVMAADQHELAMHFARPHADKFAASEATWAEGIGRTPVLKRALARFECSRFRAADGGDHVIFLGRIERFEQSDLHPLVFYGGAFMAPPATGLSSP